MTLPQRPLGKTGIEVPIIGYGTAPLGKIKLMDAPFSTSRSNCFITPLITALPISTPAPIMAASPNSGR
jgi:hypothetical protein